MTRPPFRLLAIPPPDGPVSPGLVDVWLGAGAAGPGLAVLLREPGRRPAEVLAADARLAPLRRRCGERAIPVLLSLDPEDALALSPPTDLAGLHLRGDPALELLERLRPVPRDSLAQPVPSASPATAEIAARPWLGRSCHGAPQPGHAHVDYTLFAPVYAPSTAPAGKHPAGLAALRAWTHAPGAVIFALGGVTPATAPACLDAGAHGLAGIGVFFGEPGRVEQDVAALCQCIAAHPRHVESVSPR